METKIIDGNKLAEGILAELGRKTVPEKEFVAIMVGDDPASLSFLKKKSEIAERLGIKFTLRPLSSSLSQEALEAEVRKISTEKSTGGVIIQLPLPKKYDKEKILSKIQVKKDVDVLSCKKSALLPPAVGALELILEKIDFNLEDKKVVVVGLGFLVGRPIADWLCKKSVKLTTMDKDDFNREIIKEADLVVTATGIPALISGEDIKEGAVLIDYGYGRKDGKLSGDIEIESIQKIASHFTPTPGGTGPIVVAKLFENFYKLNS